MYNFRDVAGREGYAANGGRMRSGILYRSNALDAESVDDVRLRGLGLTRIFDLRTTAEVSPRPDVVLAGAEYLRFNVIGDELSLDALDPASLTDAAGARELLIDVNRLFVRDANARAEFGALLRSIADHDGAHVFHCSAGKDRTGWAAALVQRLVGVSIDDVMDDYLLTNEYSAAAIDAIAAKAAEGRGRDVGEAARVLAGVFPEALQAAFEEADTRYGGVEGYVRDGLGVDESTAERLRRKLVG
ncbi:Protein tyrosine/serine phosphatase OS=Tsukamurella paurometabola (strain ATCC 8368 / DSM /CCUG 35730 / CIP 100753 / JCM 10117 / KCTC 9821 / NBRC 16120/ NCIMB 702349 / NCTC 13040) OX=521096 GN=Tpau_2362 PE=4 SV=1 [Tsukamurella paurometabola]|uniref:Protein tyrosine/serine phosphatase n=1 Tax=Tsukamurella paurometabola (strain ATCC 8368 / DSM 20162 / CCUG 35730 / CIP 100753 / JCM 10117 / KCTC 9821 / NBRC 16120 / NCIMB 702349 / NCTC 13040) TaxID=521096 RepID=D5UQX9_TSUPD|nr:tyrosine-protein phosphatase [Tsukamurella paurometabola]ADG78968.1 protein tyrosine/serine phosphatase [Tsukamurella paurometabola DSM 20162]SUP33645.1 Tyrosine-protein phosphatase precursor [Tsukamurella paurometabola]